VLLLIGDGELLFGCIVAPVRKEAKQEHESGS
jgi:hypothetical protein